MHQYVDVTEADCLAPRSDVGRDWWPPWWPAGPTGQMSWQLCFCGGKTADREWGRHQRGEDQELIGICWDGGTQCQGHPSIHLTDLTKQCWCLEFRCCGALLVAESGWYQFQSNYCSKKFCPGIFVYCPLVAVCHPSVGADWPESDIWKYFHQIASPNWQH